MAFPTNQTVSRLGQVNAAGDDRSLFLKLYAGEVLTAFEERNVFMGLHRTRTIQNGKSASFPLVGTASAKYHTPGELIQSDAVKHGERVVTVDDLLISSQFIGNIDEAMNHYDVRSIYSKEAGYALANTSDKNIAKVIAKAAAITDATKAAAAFGASFDDEVYTANQNIGTTAAQATDGKAIVDSIYAALEEFDKKDVTGDKVCVLPPAQYYALLNASDVTSATWLNKDVGGAGSVSGGAVPMVGGVRIVMSNHIPQTDETTTSATPTPLTSSRSGAYKGDFSKLRGLIFTQDAAATVKLLDLGVESEYQIDRQGTIMVAKYAMGHNILRPACAISLNSI
jgi:hypothetical protein